MLRFLMIQVQRFEFGIEVLRNASGAFHEQLPFT